MRILISLLCLSLVSCDKKTTDTTDTSIASILPVENTLATEKELSEEFKNYWYAGKAEITSYALEQVRYGELRKGTAALIYVTEDFLPDIQVKANQKSASTVSVLKLNATKKFNTGIYPYSIMQSTFYPVSDNQHALKISSSIQEWCGQVYAQLNTKEKFEILSHSYFQGEADQTFSLKKTILENELWTKLRIAPNDMPQGELFIIPSFEYCRLFHKEIQPYSANAKIEKQQDFSTYTITYPELSRSLAITFSNKFPYEIESWTERYSLTDTTDALVTKATRLKTITSDYWSKNGTRHDALRDTLKLN
ncbi:septum formation inhibitor Maf [Aquimarina sp. 2-A2]|uniref:septum formation inhibitor Maf n=1 Tax=Aquimarina sp. 2-A2 TaxID=3382644 RepID=UPI00387EFFA1